MKRVLLTLVILLASLTAMAQFSLQPGKITTENGKGYIVVNHNGTKTELYSKVIDRLTAKLKNPRISIYCSKPNVICINDTTHDLSFINKDICLYTPLIPYKMVIYFKDNRIRFDAPIVTGEIGDKTYRQMKFYLTGGKSSKVKNNFYFFTESDLPYLGNAKKAVEDYFNDFVIDIMSNIEHQGANNEW